LILKKCSGPELQQAALRNGMNTLRQDAMEKVLLGLTTLEECLRVLYVG
jgi:type II secretory ATPase GspE/PulE/Tfp pilus assembly ATPase PilB-like protein